MASYSPTPAFHEAVKYLSNAPSLAKVSNNIKLELYGLFKYLTVSPSANTSRPSLFDFTGRAKWDAWAAAGNTYKDGQAAEERYKAIARQLGWVEGATLTQVPHAVGDHNANEEEVWDQEEGTSSGKAGGGGMGLVVSTMRAPSPGADMAPSAHSLALRDDGDALSAFLAEHPDVNINEPDEYGYTPLHLASDRGNATAVKVLLNRGADRGLKDPDDFTAIELAEVAGHADVVAALR